jgi:UDP-N-acetylglucosamine 2-epimerase (non-hydrolysing)
MPRTWCYVVGTRPNFMKTAPVLAAMRERAPDDRHVLVHTGQHYDDEMSRVFFEQLGVPEPDHYLGVGSGGHGAQTARVMEALEPILVRERPDVVIVPGDVNSTLAAAITAAKLTIPVAHIESGLRSFDRTMPEELNRLLTDQIAEFLFIHSPEAHENLLREGVDEAAIHFVGNTMIDTLVALRDSWERAPLDGFGLDGRPYLLVTLHRPALVDGPLLGDALRALREVADRFGVVFPVHPRTRAAIDAGDWDVDGIQLVPPVGYLEFLALQSKAAAVLTDSGGVQEETTFLGIPCFTLRDNTERPITVSEGTNTLLGLQPGRIAEIPGLVDEAARAGHEPPAGWDGHAAERVADVLTAADL